MRAAVVSRSAASSHSSAGDRGPAFGFRGPRRRKPFESLGTKNSSHRAGELRHAIIPRTSEAGTTAFTIRLRRPGIIKANDDIAIMSRPTNPRAPFAARLSGLSPCVCRSGLARKPFTKDVRLYLPRERSGHEGVHDAVQPAWNDPRAVFEQTAEALRYALLDAHRLHRHGFRIEAEFVDHRCVRKSGCQYSDVDTQRFELIVKRFAKAMYICLRSSVIRHNWNSVLRTHCPREDDSAPTPLAEFLTKMVGNVQMSHRTKPQGLLK